MKRLLFSILILGYGLKIKAYNPPDEGMWLPLLIGKNYEEMKRMGFKLTPEDVYSVNKSSLKDAIVWLQFCTGSFISSEGLMLTNHHCAYSSIQYHSSVQNDYLTNGFWAMEKSQEKHCPEITASVLYRMEDVTDEVKQAGANKDAKIKEIEKRASEGGKYMAQVKEMFYGGEYYVFVYEVFKDVRLVGAPPSSIGKFGGDTDNWVWPRHTGDFSLFRVYASPDNKPAEYSEKNVPYKPKHFLPINIRGIQENDFAMVFGYPGRTDRYQASSQIQLAVDYNNPALVKIMAKRLETMKKQMDKNPDVKIKLADKYASLANGWKYYLGQLEGLKRMDVVGFKQSEEKRFMEWAKTDATYAKILPEIQKAVDNYKNYTKSILYLNVGIFGVYANSLGLSFVRLWKAMKENPEKKEAWEPLLKTIKGRIESHFKDYDAETDRMLLIEMMMLYYENVEPMHHPAILGQILKKYKGASPRESFEKYAKASFAKTMLSQKSSVEAFLSNPTVKALDQDPLVQLVDGFFSHYQEKLQPHASAYNEAITKNKALYIEGLRKMNSGALFYPDANFTPRITYGKVTGYTPFDGAYYQYFTTTAGITQKFKPKDEEFDVPEKLLQLIKNKDFGRYGKNGELRVAFITDNDITGGNSGSSVIDGEGNIIGLAFDGNWEAMTGDIVFDKQYKRCIANDIRYVLFIIDKFAGATHLIQEMKLIE